mmetsp:Transcript_15055/g.56737  ORF Transcript_15055/g.56737 Transcript_15055/m.56737 type:complete len:383 (-) Transcript_15055:1431-2579(-)
MPNSSARHGESDVLAAHGTAHGGAGPAQEGRAGVPPAPPRLRRRAPWSPCRAAAPAARFSHGPPSSPAWRRLCLRFGCGRCASPSLSLLCASSAAMPSAARCFSSPPGASMALVTASCGSRAASGAPSLAPSDSLPPGASGVASAPVAPWPREQQLQQTQTAEQHPQTPPLPDPAPLVPASAAASLSRDRPRRASRSLARSNLWPDRAMPAVAAARAIAASASRLTRAATTATAAAARAHRGRTARRGTITARMPSADASAKGDRSALRAAMSAASAASRTSSMDVMKAFQYTPDEALTPGSTDVVTAMNRLTVRRKMTATKTKSAMASAWPEMRMVSTWPRDSWKRDSMDEITVENSAVSYPMTVWNATPKMQVVARSRSR